MIQNEQRVRADSPAQSSLDNDKQNQVAAARGVMKSLLKSIKQMGLYRHATEKYAEFLKAAHLELIRFTEDFGTLQLKVELTNFCLHGAELFDEGNPISYRFFKDGIRQILFRPGFTLEELVTFTTIALSDVDRGAEDINAQLWRAQMPHFEHIMVHGFRMDEFSEEAIQIEVDKVVDYLQRRLRSNNQDYLRFATITEDDLDLKLDDIEQMRGSVVAGVYATPSLKATLQKEVEEEETQRLFPKLVAAVFQVVDDDIDDSATLIDMLTQLLDAMLLQEDWSTINQVVLRLKAAAQKMGAKHPVTEIQKAFLARMGDDQRLNRMSEVLRFSKLSDSTELKNYLLALNESSTPQLLDLLESIELHSNRVFLTEVLVPFAKRLPQPFIDRLESPKPQVVRDMISILDKSNHPDKIKFFTAVLKSNNLSHKLEAMAIIARGRTGEARNLLAALLKDPSAPVRMQAARVLPAFGAERAFTDLTPLVEDKAFEKCEPAEREALFASIGSTRLPAAFAFFEQRLQTKAGLLNRKPVLESKLLAVAGVAGANNQQAHERLSALSHENDQPAEVKKLAGLHAERIRKQLDKHNATKGELP